MAHLIKIGNSQGIRIPQALIKQANLQDRDMTTKGFHAPSRVALQFQDKTGLVTKLGTIDAKTQKKTSSTLVAMFEF